MRFSSFFSNSSPYTVGRSVVVADTDAGVYAVSVSRLCSVCPLSLYLPRHRRVFAISPHRLLVPRSSSPPLPILFSSLHLYIQHANTPSRDCSLLPFPLIPPPPHLGLLLGVPPPRALPLDEPRQRRPAEQRRGQRDAQSGVVWRRGGGGGRG